MCSCFLSVLLVRLIEINIIDLYKSTIHCLGHYHILVMNFNSLKHLNHRVTIFRYTIASFEDDFDLISSRCYNILVNRKMNPKIVMMLAKQVQECQKKMPDGKTPYIKIGIKIIIN